MKRLLVVAAAGLLLVQPLRSTADETAPAEIGLAAGKQALQFRRVYAPNAKFNDWPLGNVPYLPMEAKDFEQLIGAAHQNDQSAPRATGAQLLHAEYRARLRSPDVLEGEATLSIEHRTTPAVLLTLEPLRLAISQAAWEPGDKRGAVLGRNSDGRVGVMVERSADLKLSWSLRGERGPAGEMTFGLDLPVCPAGHLTIDLPAALVPSVDRGLVRQRERPDNATRRWSIDLGGSHHLQLRIVSSDVARPRKPLALVRQTTAYEFSPRGIDVSVQLRLDVHDAPLERLELQIDPRLQLVAAHYADRDVPWTTGSGPGGTDTRAVLEFPDPIAGTGRIVRLSALAPLEQDQRWRLPVVRAEGTTWLEGTAQLVVPKPLVVEQLVTTGCRQSKVAPLGAPLVGESLEFQSFSPEAAIEVVVGRPLDPLHVDIGSEIELSAVETSCRSVVELSLRQREEFVIGCEIGPQWLIDSVDSSSPETIEDWQIETPEGRPPRLTVSLKKGVSPARPVRLTILGHRAAQANQGLGVGELEMLRFEGTQQGKRWLALRASDAQELQLSGADELVRLDPQQFTPAESRLFAEPPTGLVFALTPTADRLRVGTAPRKPGYSGDISIDVMVDGTSLTETFIFRCAPQSSRLDRVLLFCSPAREAPLRFSLAGGSSGQISARRLPTENFTSLGAAPGGEVWEITLRLPRTGPFEIRGVRTVPLAGKTPLSLASLPEAANSRGTLAIRALGETGVTIDNQRLKPIPAELSQADSYQTARGAFRYEPSRDAASPDPAIFVSAAGPNPRESGAWVWQARLDSRYALRDATVHMASWRVQTAGRSQLHFTLPPAAELRSIAVDEIPQAAGAASPDAPLAVDLPAGKQFVTVVVYFTTPGELPRLSRSIEPAWPEVDVPVLGRRWKLWMPAGYELVESDGRWESPAIDTPTWTERLFGPFGRRQRASTFDPLAAADWSALVGRGGEDRAAQANLLQFRSALSAALDQVDSRKERSSWGELFGQVSQALAMAEITVLADVPGLNQISLKPETGLPPVDSSAGRDRDLALLRQARLFVLSSPQGIVLTSEPAVSDYRTQLGPTGQRQSGQLLPGSLVESLDLATHGAGSGRTVGLAQWATRPAGPWLPAHSALSPSWESLGWNTYTLSWEEGPVAPVRMVHTTAMQSLSWGVFLLVLAIAAWRLLGRLNVLVVLAGAWAAAALLASAAFVPIAAAGFLAALCGILLAITERQRVPDERSLDRPQASFAPASAMLLALTALSALGLGAIVDAAETPTTDAAVAPAEATTRPTGEANARQTANPPVTPRGQAEVGAVQRVFVPVDDAQKPVGSMIYIPREFYDQLLRQAAAASEQPGDWLLTRAAYRATLSPVGAQKDIGVAEFKATFDLQVFRPNVEVKLPLGHEGLSLVPGSAKLDGRPIEVVWPESQRTLSFVVQQAGAGRLELAFEPAMHSEGGMTGFELAIPPLPDASLTVTSVGDPVAVEVTGAHGAVSSVMAGASAPAASDHELHANIGPSDRIGLRWPDESSMATSLPNLDVEELIWVKLQPGSPVVDARFKFRVIDGKVRRVRILADPRLRLLPSWDTASGVTALHILPGDPETIELELSAGAGEQVVIDLTFLVAGTSGIGNFRLPRLEASGARLTSRLLAVTVDPALHWEEQLGDEVRQLTPTDFAAAWGESPVKPQLVYAIPRGEAAWSLATRPREARSSIDQTVILGVGVGTSSVELNATINTTAGHQFQLRLIGPPELEVDSVTLLDDGVERVARWAQGDAGTITAFLTGPVSGRQQFALRGRLRTATAGEFVFPSFQWPNAEVKKNQLQIFRQSQTLVDIEPAPDMSAIDPPAIDKGHPELGRLVAAYTLGSTQTALKVKVTANVPDTEAREVIVVQREQDQWTATVDYQVTVGHGLLDVLRFEIPPQWSEPYQVDRMARVEIVPIPGESRRQLVIYPLEPIADQYRVRIRGRVVPSMGDRLRVPDVIPRGAIKLDRFVSLPSEWESQQVDWEMTGLTPTTAPADWRMRPSSAQPTIFYQVLGERFQAAIKSIERVSGRPRVRLADISAAWHADGAFTGVASFDLDPAGSGQAVLNVPPQVEVVHLSVAGLPVAAAPAGPDSWRFALQSTQLPQRIEVVFRGSLGARSGAINRVQVPAPGIEGVEVDRTLWTVYGPPSAGPATLLEPTSGLTPVRQELSRLEATESILGQALNVASEQAPEEIRRWYAPWNARFVTARNRVQELARQANRPSAARDQQLESLNRQEMSIAERLGIGSGSPEEASQSFDAARIFDAVSDRGQEPARCLSAGDAPALTLRYPRSPGNQFVWRLLAALLVVALATAVSRALRQGSFALSPRVVALLLSLFTWLCLAPSGLGFIALSLTIIAIAARRWQLAMPELR